MTTAAISITPRRTTPQALWCALLALLLAVQTAAGGQWRAEPIDSAAQALRVVATVPAAAQFREAGKVVQGASRAVAPQPRSDGHDGGPAPADRFAVLTGIRWSTASGFAPSNRPAPRVHRAADRYSARALPPAA